MHGGFSFLNECQDTPGVALQGVPSGGQVQGFAETLVERGTQLFLQLFELHRDRGLAEEQFFPGPGETAMPRYCAQ